MTPSILYEFVADIQNHIPVTTYTKYVCRRLLLGQPHPSVLDANCQCRQNLSGLHFTDLPASIVRFRRRRVVRRLGLPASRAPAFPEERERRPEKEGRKVENEWKAVVPGMDSAQPIQAWLNELTTELGEHYEDPTMLALIDKNKILFLLGQLD